jgi:hypothetical protein
MKASDDVISLMKAIKDLVYATDNTQFEFWTMQSVLKTLVTMKQGKKEHLQAFGDRFLRQLESTEQVWGELIPRKYNEQDLDQIQKPARDQFLACLFLAGVDRDRYRAVIDDLNNEFILGKVNYPKDVPSMLKYLINRRGAGGNKKVEDIRDGIEGTSLAQKNDNNNQKKKFTCYTCGKEGHKSPQCPENKSGSDTGSIGSEINDPAYWKKKKQQHSQTEVGWDHQGFQIDDKDAWAYTGNN